MVVLRENSHVMKTGRFQGVPPRFAQGACLSAGSFCSYAGGHRFAYDAQGDQTLAIQGFGTPQQATTKDYYDGDGNLTESIDADGNLTTYYYDSVGNLTLEIAGYGTSAASATSYGYDADGNETLVVVGYDTPAAESTVYGYDAAGNQTLQEIGGDATVSKYDGDGNLTQQIDPDGNVSDFKYDAMGNQTQSTLGSSTAQDLYDGDGNLTESIDADGNVTSYYYDPDSNLTLAVQAYGSPSASETSYGYDAAGNQTLVVTGYDGATPESTFYGYDADGNQTLQVTGYNSAQPESTIFKYDNDNNLTQSIDPDGNTSDYYYDSLGDQTQSIIGAGSSNPGSSENYYDGDGNLTLSINAVGDSTSYGYDAVGNQTLEIDGYNTSSAATVQYKYDAAGNQTQEIDSDNNTTSYEYDSDGNQTLMIQAYGTSAVATTAYQYDDDGNLLLQTNPNGTSIRSSYDDEGNLTSQIWYAGSTTTNSISYTYDPDGNMLTASNDAGAYSFSYNSDGEETQVVTPNGVTMNYQYDSDGDVTQITDSLGDTVTSQYDANGNLIQRDATGPNGAQIEVDLTYDGDNNPISLIRQGQVNGQLQMVGGETESYDDQGNLTYIVQANAAGNTLDSFSYSYDAAGQVTQEVDYNTGTTDYSYDATGQLISAGATDYSYDANGNPNNSGDTVGPNNELLSDGTWDYSYDANGNNTGKVGISGGPDAGRSWTYSYDTSNELISATETNSQNQTLVQANYTYDVFGNLIESSVSLNGAPAVITYYVYNGSTLWATETASNTVQTLYVSGDQPDQYYAQIDATTGVGWYLTDDLDSVRDVMNNSSQVTDTLAYNAYGELISQTDAALTPLIGYTGFLYQASVSMDKSEYRWYNPQTGQWQTEDPDLLVPGPNPREYVNDSPTNGTDPTGLFDPQDVWDQLTTAEKDQWVKLRVQGWQLVSNARDDGTVDEVRPDFFTNSDINVDVTTAGMQQQGISGDDFVEDRWAVDYANKFIYIDAYSDSSAVDYLRDVMNKVDRDTGNRATETLGDREAKLATGFDLRGMNDQRYIPSSGTGTSRFNAGYQASEGLGRMGEQVATTGIQMGMTFVPGPEVFLFKLFLNSKYAGKGYQLLKRGGKWVLGKVTGKGTAKTIETITEDEGKVLWAEYQASKAPKNIPHGFASEAEFNAFGKQLNEGLAKAGYGETKPIFQGSSVTGKKFTTGEAFDVGRVSDFDIALADPKLIAKAKELGIGLRSGGTRTGPLTAAELEKLGLKDLAQQLSKQAGGREVNFMIFDTVETATGRSPSIVVPK